MNGLETIHDDCLEYELQILSSAEELCNRRNKAYRSGNVQEFKNIIPLLDSIKQDAELFKEYLEELNWHLRKENEKWMNP